LDIFNWSFISFFLWVGGTDIWTQSFTAGKQLLYWLSHISSPFCSGYFWDGVLQTICLVCLRTAILLISASQVARITRMSHWFSAFLAFWNKWLSGYRFYFIMKINFLQSSSVKKLFHTKRETGQEESLHSLISVLIVHFCGDLCMQVIVLYSYKNYFFTWQWGLNPGPTPELHSKPQFYMPLLFTLFIRTY
jgi:hypothetical protein